MMSRRPRLRLNNGRRYLCKSSQAATEDTNWAILSIQMFGTDGIRLALPPPTVTHIERFSVPFLEGMNALRAECMANL